MAITKLANSTLNKLRTSNTPLARATRFNFGHPLGLGLTSFGIGSGQSVGETAGMGIGGYGSYIAANDALKKFTSKPNVGRFLPGKLRPVANFAGALATSFGGSEIGKRIGQKIPIYKRKGNTV